MGHKAFVLVFFQFAKITITTNANAYANNTYPKYDTEILINIL